MLYDVMHGLVGEGVMDRQSTSYEAWNSSWGELFPSYWSLVSLCSALLLRFTFLMLCSHHTTFSPYFEVPNFLNELLDKNRRTEANWRWLGNRKWMLKQYVWTVQRWEAHWYVPSTSQISSILNIRSAVLTSEKSNSHMEGFRCMYRQWCTAIAK